MPGEDIVVNISCDNSKCRKPVKEFKLKVQRSMLGLGYKGKYCKQRKYMFSYKSGETCQAKSSTQVQLRLKIPAVSRTNAHSFHPYLKDTM